jgi:predicted dehydrogenase
LDIEAGVRDAVPRVAVVGAGAFGKNHLRVLHESPNAKLVAVVDQDEGRAAHAAAQYNCHGYRDIAHLADIDAAVVAVPTTDHADVACALLERGIDVLLEKPIAPDLCAARRIIEAAEGRILQVGHLERFNPAVQALRSIVTLPLFFEIHRLSVFTPRSLDVDVVLDLMIHDIDVVLSLVGKMPEEVRAAGISVLSTKPDIANVRLAFEGGCVANLTASRVSTERVRKIRLFQPDEYISLDYHRQDVATFSVSGPVGDREVEYRPLPVQQNEPLKLEVEAFLASVRARSKPEVSGEDALRALEVSMAILDKIEEHSAIVAQTLGRHAATSANRGSS